MSDSFPEQMACMAVFVAVIEAGSFSGAAKALGVSKSAVSKQVARLEALLNVQLLRRTTRSLSPTAAGQALYERTAGAIAACRDAPGAVSSLSGQPMGALRVTAPSTFGRQVLGPVISDFLRAYPQVQVQLVLLDRMADLVNEGIDIAVRIARTLPAGVVARELTRFGYVLCAAPESFGTSPPPQSPQDLLHHNCLRYGEGETHMLWRFDGPDGASTSVRVGGNLLVNSSESLRQAVAGGQGIALLPEYLVAQDLAAGRIVRLLPGWTPRPPFGTSVYAVWMPDRFMAPRMRVFIDFLVARFALQSPQPVR